ncbi:hypothetical protein [Streptomyces sp. NPDC058755]
MITPVANEATPTMADHAVSVQRHRDAPERTARVRRTPHRRNLDA